MLTLYNFPECKRKRKFEEVTEQVTPKTKIETERNKSPELRETNPGLPLRR